MKKYLSLFLFLIAVVTLVVTGCGGTNGYGTDAADDITYIEAKLINPLDSETDVYCDMRDVFIHFYEEINWTKDCEALVKVASTNANETGAEYVYRYDASEMNLHIERQSDFVPNAEYTVTVSEGIPGVAEKTMVKPVSFSFTTGSTGRMNR